MLSRSPPGGLFGDDEDDGEDPLGPLGGGAAAEKESDGAAQAEEEAAAAKAAEEAAVAKEAAAGGVDLSVSGVQLDALTRPSGREREPPWRKLQEQFECAIVCSRATLSVALRGRAEAVARLQTALQVHLDVDEHVRTVPEHSIAVIIGSKGVNIKKLQDESRAAFELDKTSCRVTIRGTKAATCKAARLLDELLERFGTQLEIQVLPRQVPLVIGRGGATIKQLQADSGATISAAKEDGCVRVRGSQAAVEAAVPLIHALLASSEARSDAGPPAGAAAPAPATRSDGPPGLKGRRGEGPPGLRLPAS